MTSSIAGGVGSVLGGGKFANGAVTGAFGYLFNACAGQPGHCGVVQAANAIVDGAYSVVEGVGNTLRFVGRSLGLYGTDEMLRSDQEIRFATEAVRGGAQLLVNSSIAREAAFEAAKQSVEIYTDEEIHNYRLAGRATLSLLSGLGPVAAIGDATRALEKGHNAIDAAVRGITGEW